MSFFPSIPLPPRKAQDVTCTFIGATFSTLITAIELAKAGFFVQILEKQSCLGMGDTGKTLLPASLSFTDNLFRLTASLGKENCELFYRVMQLGLEYLKNNQLLRGQNALEIAMNEAEHMELQKSLHISADMSLFGFPKTYDFQDNLQKMWTFALCYSNQGYIEGYEVFEHLLHLAMEQNISIVPNTTVFSFEQSKGKIILHHSQGSCSSDVLFLGAGMGNRELDVFFQDKLTPVRSQMMAIPHQTQNLNMMCEAQYGYIQFRDTYKGTNMYRLLSGCRWATPHLEVGEEKEEVIEAISQAQWRFAQKYFPFCSPDQNIDSEEKIQWSAIQTHTCDGLPIVGPLPGREHIYSLCGFRDRQATLGIGAALLLCHSLLGNDTENTTTENITSLPSFMLPRRFL